MADLKAQLEITADASGVEAGIGKVKRSLATLGQTAAAAGKQAADGVEKIGDSGAPAAAKVDASARNMIGSIQRATAALEAGTKSGSEYYRVLAGQRGIDTSTLEPYLQQLDLVASKQKKVGVSAAQTAAAMRLVPAQFTDIVTSLQGGQAPLTVLLQQGGQLKDSFGGAGAAARALGGYVSGLVNPFTIAAAGAAVLGVAAYKGAQEQTAYQKALILSGNVAGTTAGQLNAMAASIRSSSVTQGQAAEALAALASTGQVGAANLQKFAATAVLVQRTIGTSIADTAKAFEALGEEPLKATLKLNKGTNYLTLSIYEQIKALEDQGRRTEAAAVAQAAYDTAQASTAQKLKSNLGTIESVMQSLTGTAGRMWDAILAVGRQSSPEAQLGSAQKALASLQATYDSRLSRGFGTGDVKPQLDAAKAAVDGQQETVRLAARAATIEGERARINRDAVSASQANAKWVEAGLSATEKTVRALKEYRDNNAKIVAGGGVLDPKRIAAEEAAIRKANEGPKEKKAKEFQDDAATKYLETLRQQSAVLDQQLSSTAKLTEAERDQAKFAQIMADLTGKVRLTAEQKSLQSARSAIEAQLQINVLKEREVGFMKLVEDGEKRRATALKATADAVAGDRVRIAESLAQQREQYSDRLGVVGLGSQAAEELASRQQVEREYARMLSQSTKRASENATLESDAYKQGVQDIAEARAAALDINASYYARLRVMQGDWSLGAAQAIANYRDESANTFRQIEQLSTNAFKGIEDQLVRFTMTGKLSFKSLADSILSDLVRIQVRASITSALGGGGGAFSSLIGAVTGGLSGSSAASAANVLGGDDKLGAMVRLMGLTKNAAGGVYNSASLSAYSGSMVNKPTLFKFASGAGVMGEAGPEAILPLRRGADGKLGVAGGGGGSNVIVNNYSSSQVETEQQQNAEGGFDTVVIIRALEKAMAGNVASGVGPMARAIEGRYGSKTATR